MKNSFYTAVRALPRGVSDMLLNVDGETAANVFEIRIRSNRPLILKTNHGEYMLTAVGKLTKNEATAFICKKATVRECFLSVCGHSVYTYQECIAQGFVTMPHGHRVGIAGSAVVKNGEVTDFEEITSLNIRIARTDIYSVSPQIKSLVSGESIKLLISGSPCSGKTTVLRGISKLISDSGKNVAVLDEREEIWPQNSGFEQNTEDFAPIPLRCDVISGAAKGTAAVMALRSLSPQVIICDEIGTNADCIALLQALNSGVGIVATAHADSIQSLVLRPQINEMLKNKIFEYIVQLENTAKVKEVVRVADIV